jgi:hypothetical protein
MFFFSFKYSLLENKGRLIFWVFKNKHDDYEQFELLIIFATVAIVPDDGPVWSKHVVLE